MLLVPTFVAESRIHGMGVFTCVPIRRDSLVWRLDTRVDWSISAEVMRRIPDEFRTLLMVYAYQKPDGDFVLCGDNAMLMNHSPTPNLIELEDRSVAAYNIDAGEELTSDYRHFDAVSARSGEAWLEATVQEPETRSLPRAGAPQPPS